MQKTIIMDEATRADRAEFARRYPPTGPVNETRQQRRARERAQAKRTAQMEKLEARRKPGFRTGGGF